MMRIAAVTVLAVSLSACGHQNPYEKPVTPVTVAIVESYSDSGNTTKYSATVEPQSRTDVSFRVGGYVQQLGTGRAVQEGDTVASGAILARLRDTEYTEKVNEARSGLDQATAGVEQARFSVKAAEAARDRAQLDLQRANNLFAKQSLTKPELDAASAAAAAAGATVSSVEAQVTQGQARIAGARAQLAQAELALRDCTLVAPSGGVVLKRSIEVGSLAGPGTPAYSLMDVSTMKVVFGAPDVLVNRLRQGQALKVTSEAVPGAEFAGHISRIAPAADARTRAFDIEVSIPNRDNRLKSGMIASIELEQGAVRQPVLVVPLPAVAQSADAPNKYSVFVVQTKDGHHYVQARTVTLGDPVGNRIAILSGLQAGESVVVTGSTLVRDGDSVQIVPQ